MVVVWCDHFLVVPYFTMGKDLFWIDFHLKARTRYITLSYLTIPCRNRPQTSKLEKRNSKIFALNSHENVYKVCCDELREEMF